MSLESYAVHIATPGGKTHAIVKEIGTQRRLASEARMNYGRSKGAVGLYCSDSTVGGLLFSEDAALPEHWVPTGERDGNAIVAVPKAKDRTKATRAAVRAIKDELMALPRLPGATEFTNRIGGSEVMNMEDGRFYLRACYYECIGDTVFVMTPWTTKREETGDTEADNTVKYAFQPPDCERVGLSAYYAAKEAQEARV